MNLQNGVKVYSNEEYIALILGVILIALGIMILYEYYRMSIRNS